MCFVCLSQPLPEKFVVKGVVDRFSEEFVETRRKALDKFLKRITDHPVLSFNEHFNVFLTAKVSQYLPNPITGTDSKTDTFAVSFKIKVRSH